VATSPLATAARAMRRIIGCGSLSVVTCSARRRSGSSACRRRRARACRAGGRPGPGRQRTTVMLPAARTGTSRERCDNSSRTRAVPAGTAPNARLRERATTRGPLDADPPQRAPLDPAALEVLRQQIAGDAPRPRDRLAVTAATEAAATLERPRERLGDEIERDVGVAGAAREEDQHAPRQAAHRATAPRPGRDRPRPLSGPCGPCCDRGATGGASGRRRATRRCADAEGRGARRRPFTNGTTGRTARPWPRGPVAAGHPVRCLRSRRMSPRG